jgi:dTDP-4-amino-4,6-dideoxygalactose transaminase
MDARVDGRYSGTLGDVGFFSLDKGKNITTIDGGIVITDRHDIGERLEGLANGLRPASAATRLKYLAKLLAYSAFLRPRLYWIPDGLAFLKLGTTPYPEDVAIEGYPEFLAGIGKRLFERIDTITATRVENARYAITRLGELEAVRNVSVRPGISPVYLRLPVLVVRGNRQRAIAELKRQGIGATGSFPAAVVDIPGIDPSLFRGPLHADRGRWVANHILTLPTHAYVTREALDRAVQILSDSTSMSEGEGWAAPLHARRDS